MIDQQLRRNDCAISAIKTICNVLDVDIARDVIEDKVFLDEEGASLHSVQKFLLDFGFEANYKLLDVNSLEESVNEYFPCITPVKRSQGLHYVVLNGFSNGKFSVLDPAEARTYKMSISEFKKQAHFSSSMLKYTDLEEVLRMKVNNELAAFGIKLEHTPARQELIEIFNKLTYFSYIDENYGFKNDEARNAFLDDLVHNQELTNLPWHFESLNYQKDKIKVRAPIILTVRKTDDTKTASLEGQGSSYWRLFKSIGKMRELWFIYLLTALVVSSIAYVGVFIDQILIDHVVPSYDLNTLHLFAVGVGAFYLIDTLFYIYRKFVSIHLSNALDRFFLSVFDDKLNNFSVRYLQSFRRGDLTERLSDSMRMKSFFTSYFAKILVNIIVALTSMVFLFLINWKLSMLVILVLALFMGIFYFFTPIIEKLEKQRFAKKADFFSSFIEKIDGIQVIRSLGLESYSSKQIRTGIDDLIKIQTKSRYVGLLNSVLTSSITSFASLALLILTAREMILHGSITLGMIITFLALSGKIFGAFASLLDYNLSLQEHKVILNRFFAFDEFKVKVANEEEKVEAELQNEKLNQLQAQKGYIRQFEFETIRLEKVGFEYQEGQPILQDISFTIHKGDKIWIKGKNGSGKSTLCKMLGLLYKPSEGNILLNDINIDLYHERNLRKKIAFVSGEDLLFNDTLLFNVTFGRKVDMKVLVEYCKTLELYDFIQQKSEKFHFTIHENGRNLSTGQRRKVLLLRALMSEHEVIILDEIFNGMDEHSKGRAEFLIDFIKDKTVLLISHIPTDRINFDQTFSIEKGKLKVV